MDAGRADGDAGLGKHADARIAQEVPTAGQEISGILLGQLRGPFPGDDGRSLHSYPFGQQDHVAHPRSIGGHQALGGHLAQHLSHHDGPIQAVGHLCVSAAQGDADLLTGLSQLVKDPLHQRFVRPALGQ